MDNQEILSSLFYLFLALLHLLSY